MFLDKKRGMAYHIILKSSKNLKIFKPVLKNWVIHALAMYVTSAFNQYIFSLPSLSSYFFPFKLSFHS